MMKSLRQWRDLEDGHLYNVGDVFPHDGRKISEKRLSELSSSQNKAGFALITAVESKVKAADEAEKEIAEEPAEEPKKVTRSRKKTT